jgi:cytoskeletal protein RodZ
VGLVCLGMGACSSISTVNGVDVQNSNPSDPCSLQPIACILVAGVVVGGGAIFLASRHHGKSTSSTSSSGSTSRTTAGTGSTATTSTTSTTSTTPTTTTPTTTTSTTSTTTGTVGP